MRQYSYLPLNEVSLKDYSKASLLGYFSMAMIISILFYSWFEIAFTAAFIMMIGKLSWFFIEYDHLFGYYTAVLSYLKALKKKTMGILGSRFSEVVFGVDGPIEKKDSRDLHLDAIRGIASLIIAQHHLYEPEYIEDELYTNIQTNSNWISFLIKWYGYTMVEVFVVLSGYIMAKVYWNPKRSTNLFTLIMNRVTRFYPIHIVMELCYAFLSAYLILHYKTEKKEELIIADFAKCLSLTHIWSFMPHPTGFISVCNGPSWSLSVELLMNLIMFVSIRYLPVYWSLLIFEFGAYFGYFAIDNTLLGNSRSVAIFFSFFLGVFLYKLFSWVQIKSKMISLLLDCVLLAILINFTPIVFVDKDNQFETLLKQTTRHMTWFSIALILLLNNSYLFKKLLSVKLFSFLGSISFALYLSHHSTLVLYDILIHNNIIGKITSFWQVPIILMAQLGLASFLHFEFEGKAKTYLDMLWNTKKIDTLKSNK